MNELVQRLKLNVSRSDAIRLGSSLVLAILLWGWVTIAQDPQQDRSFANIPVDVGQLVVPLEVVGTISEVTVGVTGPRSIIEDIVSADIKVSLGLDGIDETGEYTVPILVETPHGVWRTTVSPSRLPIRVEEVVTELFVIDPVINGRIDSTRQVSASILNTSEITAVGPKSSIDRIDKIIAPIEIGDQLRDFTSAVTPQALDADGKLIPEVNLSPNIVTVDVSIDARGKRVAVLTQLDGEPAQGYEVLDRTINPATVLVDGPDEVIDRLISVSTEPIDISGASETLTTISPIVGLPEGVTVIEPANGTVDVVVQIRQIGVRQPLPAQSIQVVGLGPGFTATVSPEAIAVTVVATEEQIGSLTTNDLSIQVNLTDFTEGTYTLEPVVALPPNVTWVSSDPATVTVTISRSSVPVASAVASPTSGQ